MESTIDQLTEQYGSRVIPGFVVEFGFESDIEQKSIIKRHEYFEVVVQVI